MSTVVSLRARSAWHVLIPLGVALLLGGAIAFLCVAIAFGIGVEAEPRWAPLLVAIAVAALAPVPVLVRRWQVLRPPSELVVGPDDLRIAYPALLRAPLTVPRDVMRVASVEDDGRQRFRVHVTSSPYVESEDDEFLWSSGWSSLPILAPEGEAPNVLLLFEQPIPDADPRRSTMRTIFRGEHVAGVLLAAEDAEQAERAIAPLGLDRPLTMPDALLLEEHLNAPETGRFPLGRRRLVKIGWVTIAIGLIAPIVALFGAAAGVMLLFSEDQRPHGAALAVAGLGVFGVRLALWLG